MADSEWTIEAAAAALEAGRVSSRALVEACLARIGAPDGQGPVAFLRVFGESARAAADAADGLRRAGRAASRFAGIPVSIKDLFDVAGEPTPAGSRLLAGAPAAAATAPAIGRLLGAGFVLIGRTNMTEFAFSGLGLNPHYGTPLSPWRREEARIAGGSSSGAAVSVAERMAFAGIGTDTGGSCRIPAALCGVVGFKPTARRVPLEGVLPLAPSLDSVGPLASTAACCAAVDAVLAGEPGRRLPEIGLAGARLLWPENLAARDLDASTEQAVDRALARLGRAGAIVERRPVRAIEAMNEAHARGGLAAAEAYAWHESWLGSHYAAYDPRVASRIAGGATMTAAEYFRLARARAAIAAQFAHEMEGFAALVLPTVPLAPPRLAEFADDSEYRRLNFLLLRNPAMINFFDGCAISLPCHAPGDAPAGLMLAAPAMRDAALLGLAAAVEAVLRGA